MKIKDLSPNLVICDNNGKIQLTIKTIHYVEHNMYRLSFYDIEEISYLDGDTEVRVL